MLEIFRTPYLFFDIETREPERAISREKPLWFVTLAAALRTFFFRALDVSNRAGTTVIRCSGGCGAVARHHDHVFSFQCTIYSTGRTVSYV